MASSKISTSNLISNSKKRKSTDSPKIKWKKPSRDASNDSESVKKSPETSGIEKYFLPKKSVNGNDSGPNADATVSKKKKLKKKKSPLKHSPSTKSGKPAKKSVKQINNENEASPKLTKTPVKSPSAKKAAPKTPEVESSDESGYINEINPLADAKDVFCWLISPMSIEDFFKNNWEEAPLHVQRGQKAYYKQLLSTPMIDAILRRNNVFFTKNLDVTSYSDGQRETHNPPGRALPSVVWDYYSNGCSIRMLNPQTFISKIHAMNAALQEFFGCFVGANFYLTPPGSQGFAPHYDDIEAFILQVEGRKRWRLYKPRNESEYLPRFSSENLQQSSLPEPILDIVLEAGDILYFPRGTIHQGETPEDSHSLHLTLSVYQKNSWADFLEKLLPTALQTAVQRDSRLREGLPLGYLGKIGCAYDGQNAEFRREFVEKTKELLHRIVDSIDVDAAADQMAKGHIHDVLPPVLTPVELECSILEDGETMVADGKVENRVEIEPDTRIRLTRAHCARLVEEDGVFRLYYSTENSREYHEYDVQYLELDGATLPAVKKIISSYPEFICVDELPIEGEDNKVQVARDLWERCIVLTDVPLPSVE